MPPEPHGRGREPVVSANRLSEAERTHVLTVLNSAEFLDQPPLQVYDSFTEDFGATEWFALNVFLRDGDAVYRTYFLQNGPMVSNIGSVTSLASLTPYGGQIEGEDVPDGWPQETFSFWMRRHDEFDEPAPSARGTSRLRRWRRCATEQLPIAVGHLS